MNGLRRRLMALAGIEEDRMKEIIVIKSDTSSGADTIEHLKSFNEGKGYELYTSEAGPSIADYSSRKLQLALFYNGSFLGFARASSDGTVSSVFASTSYDVKLYANDRYIKTTILYQGG